MSEGMAGQTPCVSPGQTPCVSPAQFARANSL